VSDDQVPLADFIVPSIGGSVVYDADVYRVDHLSIETHTHADLKGRRRHLLKVTFSASFDDQGYAEPLTDLDLI
jgi:hypothetical protein